MLSVGLAVLALVMTSAGVRGQQSQQSAPPNQIGGPSRVTALAAGPNWPRDGIVLAARGDQIFRTTNGGASWDHLLAPELVVGLSLAPSSSGAPTAFALGGQRLYRSTDLGSTWTSVATRPDRLLVSPDFAGDGLAFSLTAGALARSTDGGLTWSAAGAGDEWRVHDLLFPSSFARDHTLLAVANGPDGTFAVHASPDGGQRWQLASVPVPSELQVDDGAHYTVTNLVAATSYRGDGILLAAVRGVDIATGLSTFGQGAPLVVAEGAPNVLVPVAIDS